MQTNLIYQITRATCNESDMSIPPAAGGNCADSKSFEANESRHHKATTVTKKEGMKIIFNVETFKDLINLKFVRV